MQDMAICRFSYECRECKEVTLLDLDFDDVARWKAGALIQNVFPQLSEGVRELMISGICGNCFDDLFADEQPSEFDDEAPAF
jgi:hypothetical protein